MLCTFVLNSSEDARVNFDYLEKIKRTTIIAMFSDDDLMERLVLKGGNALGIVHKVAQRVSVDLDFSIETEFKEDEIKAIQDRIRNRLVEAFKTEGYHAFDISFTPRPHKMSSDMADFWGGYWIEFKVIEMEKYEQLRENTDALRRQAAVVGGGQKRKIKIEISKFEYCREKQRSELDGYTIYVYTPAMIVIEKLRAICQQMPEYAAQVRDPSPSARARDFFDIYVVMEHFNIDLTTEENVRLLKNIFAAKRVPLKLIWRIPEFREFHRENFASVKDTVRSTFKLEDFDFYFDYVIGKCQALKASGIV
jgi:hypothetical protein